MRPQQLFLAATLTVLGAIAAPTYAYDPMPDPRMTGGGVEKDERWSRRDRNRGRADSPWDARNGVRQPAFGKAANEKQRPESRPRTR